MKKFLTFTFIFILLTGCMQSKFDRYYEEAKNAMISKEYSLAIEKLELAIIEDPRNKDALALKKIAAESLEKFNFEEEVNKFLSESSLVYKDVLGMIKVINVKTTDIESALKLLPVSEEMIKEAEAIENKWKYSKNKYIKDAAIELHNTTKSLNSTVFNLTEDYVDPNDNKPNRSRYQAIRSQTSRNVAMRDFSEMERNLSMFKENISKLKP